MQERTKRNAVLDGGGWMQREVWGLGIGYATGQRLYIREIHGPTILHIADPWSVLVTHSLPVTNLDPLPPMSGSRWLILAVACWVPSKYGTWDYANLPHLTMAQETIQVPLVAYTVAAKPRIH